RLNTTRGVVVLLADHERVELTAGRVERVHRGIDTERGNLTGQHHGRVQVRERRGGRGIGQVVRGYVHRLNRGDRARFCGSDALLEHAHLFRQCRLIAYSGGHTPKECRHLRTRERVTVDVVYEEQYVAALAAILAHFVT